MIFVADSKPKKEKQEKLEGDGRIAEDKSKHKGDWGKHEPTKEKPADRNKGWKPWKKRSTSPNPV
jgi:hypothetical protein